MASRQIATSLSHTIQSYHRARSSAITLFHSYHQSSRKNPTSIIFTRRLHFSLNSRRARLSPPPPPPPPPPSSSPSNSPPITAPKKTLMSASIFSIFASLFNSSARAESSNSKNMAYPDQRTDEEWRAVLSPEQFRIIRSKGTEPAFTGSYDKHYPSSGVYNCAACDTPLYKADTKFKSGCGWPAYFDSIPGAVTRHVDRSLGMERTEIVCSNCGGHLGHVFKGEGYSTPTDERHCVNSVSLKFTDGDGDGDGGEGKKSTAKA